MSHFEWRFRWTERPISSVEERARIGALPPPSHMVDVWYAKNGLSRFPVTGKVSRTQQI